MISRPLRPSLTVFLVACFAVVAGVGWAAPGAGAETADEAAQAVVPVSERLSDEFAYTRSASATTEGHVRSRPWKAARKVARLRLETEDGYPEVYLLLERKVTVEHGEWVRIRIPGRPNGRTGWVPRHALGNFRFTDKHLKVNTRTGYAAYFVAGKKRWQFPVGTGAPGTPTPHGRFWIREKFKVRGGSGGIYGPVAFGTANYSVLSEWPRGGVIGIHGTNQPGLIPGRPSHGCIRVRNWQVKRLYKILPVGASLHIV